MSASPAHRAMFLRRVVRDQHTIGAVAQTSAGVARAMARLVTPLPDAVVVELGAGTGAISRAVGPRLGPGGRHVAVERDPAMLAALESTAPWALRLPGDAGDLVALLEAAGVTSPTGRGVDVVLSSLPWSYFPAEQRMRVLEQIGRVLAPTGVFATIAYRPTRLTPRSRAFRADLAAVFGDVITTATMWANIPPARLYVCRHPLGSPTKG